MLQRITIDNFIFIEKAIIDLQAGLTVISGETGAGKSIFLGALSTTLGERISADFIQPGKDYLRVSTSFNLEGLPEIRSEVNALFSPSTPNNLLTLTRQITRDGKSKCFINNQLTNIQTLQKMAACLIDIHSQHHNQHLFTPKTHVTFYDAFLGNETHKNAFQEAYENYLEVRRQLHDFNAKKERLKQEKEFLLFTIKELEGSLMSEEEYLRMKETLATLEVQHEMDRHLSEAHRFLKEDVLPRLYDDQKQLQVLMKAVPSLKPLEEHYTHAIDRLEEIQAQSAQATPTTHEDHVLSIDEINAKLAKAESLRKKYHMNLNQLHHKLSKAKEQLAFLDSAQDTASELSKQYETAENKAVNLATTLHMKRKEGRQHFEDNMQLQMNDLNMQGSHLSIDLRVNEDEDGVLIKSKKAKLGAEGFDNAEFLYRSAPNVPFKRLRNIASGGEISRLTLALKSLVREKKGIPVMIFDEIDMGIGGKTALRVGHKLSLLAQNRQILVITHLAQIAKFARSHFRITKTIHDKQATTFIESLNQTERLREIARMLTGKELSQENQSMIKKFLSTSHDL